MKLISVHLCAYQALWKQTLEDNSYIKVQSWKPPGSVVANSCFTRKWPINFAETLKYQWLFKANMSTFWEKVIRSANACIWRFFTRVHSCSHNFNRRKWDSLCEGQLLSKSVQFHKRPTRRTGQCCRLIFQSPM